MTTATRVNGTSKHGKPSIGKGLQALAYAELSPTQRDYYLSIAAASGVSTVTGADGGFLSDTAFSDELLRGIHDTGWLLRLTRRIPLADDKFEIELPVIDEKDLTDGKLTGIDLARVPEGDSIPQSKMLLGKNRVRPAKFAAVLPVTDELLADVSLLEDYVLTGVREESGYALDGEIISGTGLNESLGIINASATIEVAKAGAQGAATIIDDNLETMVGSCHPRSFANAVWITSPSALPQLMAAKTFRAPDAGADAGRLMTRPILLSEHASALGTVGDIILADLSQYLVISKSLVFSFSAHFNFPKDESAFRAVVNVEGLPKNSAKTTLPNNDEVSAFVTLAERA